MCVRLEGSKQKLGSTSRPPGVPPKDRQAPFGHEPRTEKCRGISMQTAPATRGSGRRIDSREHSQLEPRDPSRRCASPVPRFFLRVSRLAGAQACGKDLYKSSNRWFSFENSGFIPYSPWESARGITPFWPISNLGDFPIIPGCSRNILRVESGLPS